MSTARQRTPRRSATSRPGFDFTLHVSRLCDDLVGRLDELRHIDMARVAVSYSQTRKASSYGMYASLTPMRFADGAAHTIRRKERWGVQRLFGPQGEILYILTFYLPRFLDLPFREKLMTVVHELWHIGPKFDGDTRRFAGRCHAHSSSQASYDAEVAALVDRYLGGDPPASVYEFLRWNFAELTSRHGRVYGRKIPTPKLIRLDR